MGTNSDGTTARTSSVLMTGVNFQSNREFQRQSQQNDTDSNFLGYNRRTWVQEKVRKDTRRERELLTTLLLTHEADYTSDCVSKLLEEDIRYRDLGTLSNNDLEKIGFKSRKQRTELLNLFSELPNQDPSYEQICSTTDALKYNDQILSNAASHMVALRLALAATNYKLQVLPPEDVIVGDKSFASRFGLEALYTLHSLAHDLKKRSAKLVQLKKKANNNTEDKHKTRTVKLCFFSFIGIGFVVAYLIWKSKKPLK